MTGTEVQDYPMEQYNEIPQDSTLALTQDLSSDSGSECEFHDALDSSSLRHKIKVNDRTGTITATSIPNSGPDTDSELQFLTSPLRNHQHERKTC